MERNADFDYRNYFLPGPAFPVQVYPMNGNPRFPFVSSFGATAMNDLTSQFYPAFPGGNIMEEAARSGPQDQRRSPRVSEIRNPSHALIKTRNAAMPLTPLQVDEALQGLSRQIDKAIAFCEKCLDKHSQVVDDINSEAKTDARNSLWKGLLESRFDASDSDKDLLHNLSGRIEYCMQQLRDAASADPSARSTKHDKQRRFERLALKVNQIGGVCSNAANLSRGALNDREICEAMVDEMKTLNSLCKDTDGLEKNDGDKDGSAQDDGDTAKARVW